jgi:hypothetical protein
MKDIISGILFYMVWNSEVHQAHPTAIPVLLTLWIVGVVIEAIVAFRE